MTREEKLEKALRFYANKENYKTQYKIIDEHTEETYEPVNLDRGLIARLALSCR